MLTVKYYSSIFIAKVAVPPWLTNPKLPSLFQKLLWGITTGWGVYFMIALSDIAVGAPNLVTGSRKHCNCFLVHLIGFQMQCLTRIMEDHRRLMKNLKSLNMPERHVIGFYM